MIETTFEVGPQAPEWSCAIAFVATRLAWKSSMPSSRGVWTFQPGSVYVGGTWQLAHCLVSRSSLHDRTDIQVAVRPAIEAVTVRLLTEATRAHFASRARTYEVVFRGSRTRNSSASPRSFGPSLAAIRPRASSSTTVGTSRTPKARNSRPLSSSVSGSGVPGSFW